MEDGKTPLVLDGGTGTMKAGFAGDSTPRVVFPSVVGVPRLKAVEEGTDSNSCYVGNDAQSRIGLLNIRRPVSNGVVMYWEDMQTIWHHTFRELGVKPEEHPVLLTEIPEMYDSYKEHMEEVMFETMNVPALYSAVQPILALFASGRTTGVVLESGHGVSHAMAIHEGSPISGATYRMNLAGGDVTDFLVKTMMERGYVSQFLTPAGREIAQYIKEDTCYVSLDYEEELRTCSTKEKAYVLPDGELIYMDAERFRAPEALFQPAFLGMSMVGVHDKMSDIIRSRCNSSIHGELWENIVLSGGDTMFPGFTERLQKELVELAPPSTNVRIIAPAERKYSVWIGGSILAALDTFQDFWCLKKEYEETGPSVVHRKRF